MGVERSWLFKTVPQSTAYFLNRYLFIYLKGNTLLLQ